MEAYIEYRITAWQTVRRMIENAEEATQAQLDDSTRRTAKGFVINRLIEVTHLPVDLVPETVSQQDSLNAIHRLLQFCQAYWSA